MPWPSPDMTIRDVRVTMLRLPWADDPWLRGHALGATRDILVCDVETTGGITGMGYLFLFRPGMKSMAACSAEGGIPRAKGKEATATEAVGDKVGGVGEAGGADIDIMIDVNKGWSADVAIEMGRKFEQYDIYWLEEPVPADDFVGYQRIAAALDMRVVGGETHFTRYDLRPFFINPCLPILQPDPMRGGMTDLRKIAALADTWGITIAPHLFPELNVHLLASIPNGIWCENMGLIDDLWVDPPEIANGMITAPERPGHGLRFKEELLKFKI